MAEKYYAILTNAGKDLEAQALASGVPVKLTKFVVGDGNGKEITPDPAKTTLTKERFRGDISDLSLSPEQSNQVIAQLSVPSETGGFTIRELGLVTDGGILYSIASCPAIEKPVGGVAIMLNYRLAVSGTNTVTLNVATGDGLFLRRDANLKDVKDIIAARKNIGLKAAAILDVGQTQGTVAAGDDARIVNAVQKTRRINEKALDKDIILKADDVSALPIAGGILTGSLRVNADGGAVMLKPVTAGSASFLISQDSAGANNWFVGYGSVNDTALTLHNYKNGTSINIKETIAMNKSLSVTGTVTPTNYANFDARYQAKGNYTPAGQAYTKAVSDGRYAYKTAAVIGVRRGGQLHKTGGDWVGAWEAPAGCFLTGMNTNEGDDGRKMGLYYRQLQININGTWVIIGG